MISYYVDSPIIRIPIRPPDSYICFSAIYPTATLDRLWTRRRLDDYTTGTDHYLKRWRGKCPKTPNNVWSEWA